MVQVIILSDSKNLELKSITHNCIQSLKASETIDFDIFVIDNKADFEGVTNLKLNEPFNYNRFMNYAAKQSNSEWIVFCNNDLIFSKGWFTELLKVNSDVMSSRCPNDARQRNIGGNVHGNKIGYHFSGWCFAMKRSIYNKIGSLNEKYPFWCADNIVIKQLNEIDITPCLVTNSIVTHLGSKTLDTMPNKRQLTIEQLRRYDNDNNPDRKQTNFRIIC